MHNNEQLMEVLTRNIPFHFFATLDGNDVNLVDATFFRVICVLAAAVVPFEITAGLDVRRKFEVERLIVGGCSLDDLSVVGFVRIPLPDIARCANDNFDGALTIGRSVLFDRVTFNRDMIAGEPTLLDGILPTLSRLARRFNVDVGARTMQDTRK